MTTIKRPRYTPGARTNAPLNYVSIEDRKLIEADRRRERIRDYGDHMKSLMVEIKAFRKLWGRFTVEGWQFDRAIQDGPYISEYSETEIRRWMRETETRAGDRVAKAKAAPYLPGKDAGMSDAEVAAGIRCISVSGWDAYDKSRGDLCHALLEIDCAGAVAVARGFIGDYRGTLVEARVVKP